MKITEIRKLDQGSLTSKLQDIKEELFNLKVQHSMGQFANFKKIYSLKRDIAKINTVLTETKKRK